MKLTPTNIKNIQANAVLETVVHEVLGDMLRTKNLQQYDFDKIDSWSELLVSVAWTMHRTHHSTLKVSPVQLLLGQALCEISSSLLIAKLSGRESNSIWRRKIKRYTPHTEPHQFLEGVSLDLISKQ